MPDYFPDEKPSSAVQVTWLSPLSTKMTQQTPLTSAAAEVVTDYYTEERHIPAAAALEAADHNPSGIAAAVP